MPVTDDTMTSPPRRKRYNTLSPSFEKEYCFVKDIILSIKHRTSRYLDTESGFTDNECHECAKFIADTCTKLNLVAVEILSYNDFVELIARNHRQRILCIQTDAYRALSKIQKWQDDFQLDATQSRDRLLLCLHDHVYMLSSNDQGVNLGDANLERVTDFNKKVQAFKKDVDEKMDTLKDRLELQEETSTPFLKHIKGFTDYVDGAREVCLLLHSICDTTLEWMREEGRYPDVLWQQMTSNNVIRESHADRLSELRQKRAQLVSTIEKKTRVREKMERTFGLQNKERRKMKNSREMLEYVISNLEEKINRNNKDAKMSSLSETSPIREDPDRIKEKPRALLNNCTDSEYYSRRLQVMQTQYTRLKKEQRALYVSNYELKMFISNKNHQLQELQRQVDEVDVLINNVSNELTKVILQIDVLRKTRDDKLRNPGRFKKSSAQQNHTRKNKANVEEACQFIAKYIGRHWKKLYDNLSFNPPRNASRLSSDVEIWDKMSLSQDLTDEDLACKCLTKWRVLNRSSSVAQLVTALRKSSQQELANKVKSKFLVFNDSANVENNNTVQQ